MKQREGATMKVDGLSAAIWLTIRRVVAAIREDERPRWKADR